jgi:hypothetical protein
MSDGLILAKKYNQNKENLLVQKLRMNRKSCTSDQSQKHINLVKPKVLKIVRNSSGEGTSIRRFYRKDTFSMGKQ